MMNNRMVNNVIMNIRMVNKGTNAKVCDCKDPPHHSSCVHDVGRLVNDSPSSHGSCREAHAKQPAGTLEAVTDVAVDGGVLQELAEGRKGKVNRREGGGGGG